MPETTLAAPGATLAEPAESPERLARFRLKCLEKSPDQRFSTCAGAQAELASIYRELIGAGYRRIPFDEVSFRHGEINNRALSLVDLGKPADAIPLKVCERQHL